MAETGSTNADLLAEVPKGLPEGAVRVTDHQTAGRGRQSRVWHDEPGNSMLMSVLLRPARPIVAVVPLLTGLAVTDGVDRLLSGARLALKWPNDVLVPALDERKLAGILAEATTAGDDDGGLAVVIGMGLNLRWGTQPPSEIAARAATLEEVAGGPVERWAVVGEVLAAIEHWLRVAEEAGPAPILDAYRERCCTLGRQVRLQRPADTIEGTAIAIADDGALVVDTPSGPTPVTAGDAHHL